MSTPAFVTQPGLPPAVRRVRGYFAPVNRASGTPTLFDSAAVAAFDPDAPPVPWLDLGWIDGFSRTSGTKLQTTQSGAPSMVSFQAQQSAGASLSMNFERWSKLTMALTCGTLQTNILRSDVNPVAISAGGSTNLFLRTPSGAGAIQAGDMVAVDVDYGGETGYLGSGCSAAYRAAPINADSNWVRRITLNVARVTALTADGLQLAGPLLAGTPIQGMQAQPIVAFQDREGGTFFQEWSALFCLPGEQGDALFFYYPRLQSMAGAGESVNAMTAPLSQILLRGQFIALPVTDPTDGVSVCSYRTYLPCPNAEI